MAGERDGWIKEFDYLRGFAILAIVTIHTMAFYTTITVPSLIVPIGNYLTHLADFGVPVFFFVSGFVLTLRYFDRLDVRSFYRRRLTTIVVPYLIFAVLYSAYNLMTVPGYTVSRALWSIVLFDSAGTFWFIAVLLQLYLLFPLLVWWQRSSEGRGRGWEMLATSAIVYIGFWAVFAYLGPAIGAVVEPMSNFGGIVADRLFPGYLVFFALGMWAQRTPEVWGPEVERLGHVAIVPVVLLLAVPLTIFGFGLLWAIVVLPFTVLALGVLYRASRGLAARPRPVSRAMEAIGKYSFGIYLIHILVIAVIVNRLWALGIFADQALFYLILLPATVIVSMVSLFLLNLLPFGEYITGVKTSARTPRPRRVAHSRNGRV